MERNISNPAPSSRASGSQHRPDLGCREDSARSTRPEQRRESTQRFITIRTGPAKDEDLGALVKDQDLGTLAKDEDLGTLAKDEDLGTLAKDEHLGTLAKDEHLGTLAKDEHL
ncbi:MAG: hypothetical protein JW767_04755, partial [Thermoleophilia bacterium]|nr:hypothetical protein [Thermoleophilia bacterium]